MHPDLDVEALKKDWESGLSRRVGSVIYGMLPNEARPRWAAGILRLIVERSGLESTVFQEVLATACDVSLWPRSHEVFDRLREHTLSFDRLRRARSLTEQETLMASLLEVAELVAKVTYNATNPIDEFDENAGPMLPAHLESFIARGWNEVAFQRSAWRAVCDFGAQPDT